MKFSVVIYTCFLVAEGFGFAKSNFTYSTRLKRQATECKASEYKCGSGECIEKDYFCDGKEECTDGSDEISCSHISCPQYAFKCAYGPCIDPTLRCNGVNDCRDNSDEQGCERIPPSKVPTGNGCLLPEHPEHGRWKMLISSTLQPGDVALEGTVLQFECNPSFKLMPDVSISVCVKNWSQIPKCIRTCPSIPQREDFIASCSLEGSPIPCDNPPNGTVATLKCPIFYEDPSLTIKPFRFCIDGSWDFPLPNCRPVCGVRAIEAQSLIMITPGRVKKRGEFPWHVGIYRNYEYLCAGSIITPKLILTAAHCFESTATEGYSVAAGKYFRQYNDTRDDLAQFSKVAEIIIHEDYNGGKPFEAFDLAVLVLADPFKMTRYVLPVCLDVTTDFDLSNLVHRVGIVIGWGWPAETGNASDTLKYLEVEYKTKKTCDLPQDFLQYYVPYAKDKLCAGVQNQGQSVCKGDSGASLVYPNDLRRYFLRGILSVAPRTKGFTCDSNNQYALFTSVKEHILLIEKLKSRYRI